MMKLAAVQNSVEEVKEIYDYISPQSFGNGAVRDIINWTSEKQNKKTTTI
jgi:3-deoxy-D-manno-octulosonate 8-phosphate phosphatase KdsC-like HAD superfamily phosphatase